MDEESVFAAVMAIEHPDQRAAYLESASAGDAELRRKVEELLAAHDRSGGFLDRAAAAWQARLPAYDPPVNDAMPGTIIGPYKLLEQIGEGGMGLVFVAEQTHPVRRRVALKVVKPGMDTRQVLARFDVERQALAMMNHPNIAKVLDAGSTDRGRPYFVMELVKGTPVTDYCDNHRLTIKDRLKLFKDVCHAVQHAHQKGIIHRDIKPANILVESHDGRPVPKVIDFGIAKATGDRLTDLSLYTGFARMVGTPLYMSPEQAGASSLDVDTRTDVYALGVLLYELLTGVTPFDSAALAGASYEEVRRVIRENEPPRPSDRVSTMAQAVLTTAASQRGLEPRHLGRAVRGELDWVVMKCLEKDRTRRYDSAGALAADVQRYLGEEPVEACPPSRWYRARKFAKRNRAGLLAAAAILLVLLPAVAGSVGWAARDRAERRRDAERRIDAGLADVEDLHARGKWLAARDAVGGLEPLLAGGGVSPERAEHVRTWRADLDMLNRLAEIRLRCTAVKDGHFDTDFGHAEFARVFRESGIDIEVLEPERAAELIRARPIRIELAAILDDWTQIAPAKNKSVGKSWRTRLLETAREADPDATRASVRDALLGQKLSVLQQLADDPNVIDQPAATLISLGAALDRMGDVNGAAKLLQRAQLRHPADFWINHNLANVLIRVEPPQFGQAVRFFTAAASISPLSPGAKVNVGFALTRARRFSEAEASYREAIRLKSDYTEAYFGLSESLLGRRKFNEAEAISREGIRLNPKYAISHQNLGVILMDVGKIEEAAASFRESIKLKSDNFETHYNLGRALADLGKLDEAEISYRQATLLRPNFAPARQNLGTVLSHVGKWDEAVVHLREASRLKPASADIHFLLGLNLHQLGRLEEAEASYRRVIKLKPDDFEAHNNLAWLLATCPDPTVRDPGRAVEHARRAVALAPKNGEYHNTLGVALYRSGDWSGAVEALGMSMKLQKGGANSDYYFLAMAHHQLGAVNDARTWFDKGTQWMDQNKPVDAELTRFRAEAAELLGILAPPPRVKTTP